MADSDDFGLDDDDTALIAAATQIEASQHGNFRASPRPTKRRRLEGTRQVDGGSSDGFEWSGSDDEAGKSTRNNIFLQTQRNEEAAASQVEGEDDPDYYFPEDLGQQSKRDSRYKIHEPIKPQQFQTQFFDQTQHDLDEDPAEFRGPIWKRQSKPPPGPALGNGANGSMPNRGNPAVQPRAVGPRQTTLNGFAAKTNGGVGAHSYRSDANLAAQLQAKENIPIGLVQQGYKISLEVSEELADLPSDAFASSQDKPLDHEIIAISSQQTASQVQSKGLRGPQQGVKQMTIFGQPATQELSATQAANKRHAWPLKNRDEKPTHHKLDDKAMETWVFPTNLGTIRDYQYNIVARSLFHNTLVALPTGLGKTFIAATVMLNYYRWTKDAQIIFMAPTKPLIAQQMDACFGIVGIPRRDTILMTGETAPAIRAEEWLTRRVFFMTPQTVINDLKTGICDPKKSILLVVDEAHKATGGYAYTEVIKFYQRFNTSFRVLALTATPGSTVEAVQAVIDALGIARVELRTEQSLDIRQYTHEKHTEVQVFNTSDEQARIMDYFSKTLQPLVDKLGSHNGYWSKDPMQLTAYGLTLKRKEWAGSEPGRNAPQPVKGMVQALFTVLSSLAHSIGMLKFHGITPFYAGVREFQKNVDSGQTKGKYAMQIAQSEHFTKMMTTLRNWTNDPDFIGHPKLEYLREVVLNHFLDTGEGAQGSDVPPSATRIMIFASYRDSTEDICRVLKRSEPMIRPHVFVGQAASKGQEGMDQKKQNAVIQDFKSGKYNTLIATSIGEEGLDIGTVDLIVCYDASASPIRMLQRAGRTGRKRVGKVVLLLMDGKEKKDYEKAQENYLYIQKSIADASRYNYHDDKSPRILPRTVQPVVDKRVIDIPIENSHPVDLNEKKRKTRGPAKNPKRPPKKFHMPDGVRTGFVKASKLDSDEEDGSEAEVSTRKKTPGRRKSVPTTFKMPNMDIDLDMNFEPEPESAQVPALGDVLLTDSQQRDLERKYARTADDDMDVEIGPPDWTRFPQTILEPGPTKYVRPGRASLLVTKTIRAIQDVDDERVKAMRDLFDVEYLQNAGAAVSRLASPTIKGIDDDADLPDQPLSIKKAQAQAVRPAQKEQSVQRTTLARSAATADEDETNTMPVTKKPRGRPKKSLQRTASIRSAASAGGYQSDPTSATKKPRGRPRKKHSIQRTTSYGSAAAEGEESSPEPTPANMRLGTQGIDLGSDDTEGSDVPEEPDSELAEFIVKSDQPIEMDNSSQQLPDDTQPSSRVQRAPKRLINGAARGQKKVVYSDPESDESDSGLAGLMDSDSDDASSVVEELPAPAVAKPRKRRVVDDDSDE